MRTGHPPFDPERVHQWQCADLHDRVDIRCIQAGYAAQRLQEPVAGNQRHDRRGLLRAGAGRARATGRVRQDFTATFRPADPSAPGADRCAQ